LQNGTRAYERLCQIFRRADERYNSGLFHFSAEKKRTDPPDDLTLNLTIDDKVLKEIFKGLYYPESPFEFSVLPADILGHIYEQFLGKVIRLTPGHHAKVEDKPEVKKAGGVYYTPTYIVDYIVKNTVGKLLEGNTPTKVAKIRVLDPACGSGSFLLGAYQHLLDWHQEWYAKHDPEKHAKGRSPKVYLGPGSEWRLTTAEKKRILLNNIYGVDIDTQAVEVTKLSLLLKVLEGENAETLGKSLRLFHERALPDLGENIKCGNSLIGPDFYEGKQLSLLDDEERYRINAFDWNAEFPEIFVPSPAGRGQGEGNGFDIVIGNPPWGALLTEPELQYLKKRNREIIVRMIDSFMYFVHQGSAKLRTRGLFGMILPDVVLYQTDNEKLRKLILAEFGVHRVLNMGGVFHKVTRPACILVLERGQPRHQLIRAADLSEVRKEDKPREIESEARYISLSQSTIQELPGVLFVTSNPSQYAIWTKVLSVPHQHLSDLVDEDGIQRGVSPDLKDAFLVDSQTANSLRLEIHKLRRVLTGGKHVKRYFINRPDLLLIYTNRKDNFQELENIRAYIDRFKSRITCKEVQQHKHPLYSLHRPREERIFLKKQKLFGVITEDEIVLALDEERTFATDGLYLFGVRDTTEIKYVMGILNSRLFVVVYRLLTLESGRVLAQVKPRVLAQLPIRTIDFSDPSDKARHDRMIDLVETMLKLHNQLAALKTNHEKIAIQRQIDATNKQIDQLVYDLYGLTDEEIHIVEEATK
jgi:type I restriction-modification system DNA methylase subunit